MALSAGQINSAYQQAFGRNASSSEQSSHASDNSLEGDSGIATLVSQLGGSSNPAAGYNDPAMQLAKDTIAASKAASDQYQGGISAYDKANPFSQSDILAKEATNAAKSVNPYYDQLLTNYITGVTNLRGNTLQDEMRAVSKLQADSDAFTGQAKKLLDTTLTTVGQNFSDAGSYDSGARARTQGIAEADTGYDISQNQRQAAYDIGSTQIQANRVINQQIPLQTQEENQQIARNRAADIATTQNQLYNYDVAQNNYERAQAGIAAVKGNGNFQAAGAFPGLSSYDTSQQLKTLLPNVQASQYGATPLYQTPA